MGKKDINYFILETPPKVMVLHRSSGSDINGPGVRRVTRRRERLELQERRRKKIVRISMPHLRLILLKKDIQL